MPPAHCSPARDRSRTPLLSAHARCIPICRIAQPNLHLHVTLHSFNIPKRQTAIQSALPLQVYGYSVPTFGKGVVFDVDQKVRNEQFRFFTLALSKERLKGYVPLFVMEAEQYFAKWGDSGEVDLGKVRDAEPRLSSDRRLLRSYRCCCDR